ncbi:MAG: hypothetical protein JWM47_1478 [Acidimicrobiales bacterium]|nr:hypothetical protein [Acidimicrobiales bacterium]
MTDRFAAPAPSATGAIVLAGGAGTRFTGHHHKLLAALGDGTPMVNQAVAAAVEARIGPVAVVLGALGVDDVALPDGVTALANDRWHDGQATSLQVGLRWAASRGLGAVVVGLGDQPCLTAAAWRRVAATTATAIAIATYDGRRGHPTRLAQAVWPELPTVGDSGARDLLQARPELVTEVECPGDPADIDTVTDLRRLRDRRA